MTKIKPLGVWALILIINLIVLLDSVVIYSYAMAASASYKMWTSMALRYLPKLFIGGLLFLVVHLHSGKTKGDRLFFIVLFIANTAFLLFTVYGPVIPIDPSLLVLMIGFYLFATLIPYKKQI